MTAACLTQSRFLGGTRVQQASRQQQPRRAQRLAAPRAKYGDESQYFDLDDLENTAGSWDLYGQEEKKRYPELQAEFFQRAAEPISRRAAVVGVAGGVFATGVLIWGAKGSKDVRLPIVEGPKKGAAIGPRGRI